MSDLTYGEWWYQKKSMIDNQDINFNDVYEINFSSAPPKMSKEDLVRYYNIKAFSYWFTQIFNDDLKERTSKEIVKKLNRMMFNSDKARYIKEEELICGS